MVYFGVFVVTSLGMHVCQTYLPENGQKPHMVDSFAMNFLFVLQQGGHPVDGHVSKRIISLMTAFLTVMCFWYYINQLTSIYTGISPAAPYHPVRSFQDVLDQEFQVIVVGGRPGSTGYNALEILKMAKPGSAMHTLYKRDFEQYSNLSLTSDGTGKENVLPSWFDDSEENHEWAKREIIRDEKKLWFCHKRCALKEIVDEKIMALDLTVDMGTVYSGLSFRSDSEWLPLFRH